MVGVAVDAVAEHLGVDAGAAGQRRVQALQEQRGTALAGDDPGPVLVEGRAGLLGEGAQPVETGVRPAADRVRAAGDHVVGLAGADQVVGVAERVVAGRAGGGERDGVAGQAQLAVHGLREAGAGDLADQAGVQPVDAPLQRVARQALQHLRLAAGRTHARSGAGGGQFLLVDPGVGHREPGRGGREKTGAAPFVDGQPPHQFRRLEFVHFTGHEVGKASRVETGDRRNSVHSRPQRLAIGGRANTDARHGTEPRDDYPSHTVSPASRRAGRVSGAPRSG